ncbi:unnamed protein product [Amoebophrya sp. A120]|nr:unnamed protein product [Amoebophrya sp. A120]|eukprot:GSA120T00023187001.1
MDLQQQQMFLLQQQMQLQQQQMQLQAQAQQLRAQQQHNVQGGSLGAAAGTGGLPSGTAANTPLFGSTMGTATTMSMQAAAQFLPSPWQQQQQQQIHQGVAAGPAKGTSTSQHTSTTYRPRTAKNSFGKPHYTNSRGPRPGGKAIQMMVGRQLQVPDEEAERKRYEREYLESIGVLQPGVDPQPDTGYNTAAQALAEDNINPNDIRIAGVRQPSSSSSYYPGTAGGGAQQQGTSSTTFSRGGEFNTTPGGSSEAAVEAPLGPLPGPEREELPIDKSAAKIVSQVRRFNTVCVQGETGCGKSSRIPQYVYHFCRTPAQQNSNKKIIITQPRRLACITLAKRVAEEMGVGTMMSIGESEEGGSGHRSSASSTAGHRSCKPSSPLVGYKISGESKVDETTKLLFVTTGYLLQLLVNDPLQIRRFSHVILDEIHERSVDSDLLTLVLKLQRQYKMADFKLILMSATMQGNLFANYFDTGGSVGGFANTLPPPIFVGAKRFNVDILYLDDLFPFSSHPAMKNQQHQSGARPCATTGADLLRAQTGRCLSAGSVDLLQQTLERYQKQIDTAMRRAGNKVQNQTFVADQRETAADEFLRMADGGAGGSTSSATSSATLPPKIPENFNTLVADLIHCLGVGGESILVFLPGIGEITDLYEALRTEFEDHANQYGKKKMLHYELFALHSTIPIEEQHGALSNPERDTVHIYLASTIAESSLTLPKVRVVLDFGLKRQLGYDKTRESASLVTSWISHASASQRSGRCGRVFTGIAIRLYPRRLYQHIMAPFDRAEIENAPLERLYLQVKQLSTKIRERMPRIGSLPPRNLLKMTVQPPGTDRLETAVAKLADVGALTGTSDFADITLLGQLAIQLPLDLRQVRLIFFGACFGCVADCVVMACALAANDPFTLPSQFVLRDPHTFYQALSRSYECRKKFDKDQQSEPLMLRNLFVAWLKGLRNPGGGEEEGVGGDESNHFYNNTTAGVPEHQRPPETALQTTTKPRKTGRTRGPPNMKNSAAQRYAFIRHSAVFARTNAIVPKRLTLLAIQVIDVAERVLHFVDAGPMLQLQRLLFRLGCPAYARSSASPVGGDEPRLHHPGSGGGVPVPAGGTRSSSTLFNEEIIAGKSGVEDIFVRDMFILRAAIVASCSPQICHGKLKLDNIHMQAMLGLKDLPNPFRVCCMLPDLSWGVKSQASLLQRSLAKAFNNECRQIAVFEETNDGLAVFHSKGAKAGAVGAENDEKHQTTGRKTSEVAVQDSDDSSGDEDVLLEQQKQDDQILSVLEEELQESAAESEHDDRVRQREESDSDGDGVQVGRRKAYGDEQNHEKDKSKSSRSLEKKKRRERKVQHEVVDLVPTKTTTKRGRGRNEISDSRSPPAARSKKRRRSRSSRSRGQSRHSRGRGDGLRGDENAAGEKRQKRDPRHRQPELQPEVVVAEATLLEDHATSEVLLTREKEKKRRKSNFTTFSVQERPVPHQQEGFGSEVLVSQEPPAKTRATKAVVPDTQQRPDGRLTGEDKDTRGSGPEEEGQAACSPRPATGPARVPEKSSQHDAQEPVVAASTTAVAASLEDAFASFLEDVEEVKNVGETDPKDEGPTRNPPAASMDAAFADFLSDLVDEPAGGGTTEDPASKTLPFASSGSGAAVGINWAAYSAAHGGSEKNDQEEDESGDEGPVTAGVIERPPELDAMIERIREETCISGETTEVLSSSKQRGVRGKDEAADDSEGEIQDFHPDEDKLRATGGLSTAQRGARLHANDSFKVEVALEKVETLEEEDLSNGERNDHDRHSTQRQGRISKGASSAQPSSFPRMELVFAAPPDPRLELLQQQRGKSEKNPRVTIVDDEEVELLDPVTGATAGGLFGTGYSGQNDPLEDNTQEEVIINSDPIFNLCAQSTSSKLKKFTAQQRWELRIHPAGESVMTNYSDRRKKMKNPILKRDVGGGESATSAAKNKTAEEELSSIEGPIVKHFNIARIGSVEARRRALLELRYWRSKLYQMHAVGIPLTKNNIAQILASQSDQISYQREKLKLCRPLKFQTLHLLYQTGNGRQVIPWSLAGGTRFDRAGDGGKGGFSDFFGRGTAGNKKGTTPSVNKKGTNKAAAAAAQQGGKHQPGRKTFQQAMQAVNTMMQDANRTDLRVPQHPFQLHWAVKSGHEAVGSWRNPIGFVVNAPGAKMVARLRERLLLTQHHQDNLNQKPNRITGAAPSAATSLQVTKEKLLAKYERVGVYSASSQSEFGKTTLEGLTVLPANSQLLLLAFLRPRQCGPEKVEVLVDLDRKRLLYLKLLGHSHYMNFHLSKLNRINALRAALSRVFFQKKIADQSDVLRTIGILFENEEEEETGQRTGGQAEVKQESRNTGSHVTNFGQVWLPLEEQHVRCASDLQSFQTTSRTGGTGTSGSRKTTGSSSSRKPGMPTSSASSSSSGQQFFSFSSSQFVAWDDKKDDTADNNDDQRENEHDQEPSEEEEIRNGIILAGENHEGGNEARNKQRGQLEYDCGSAHDPNLVGDDHATADSEYHVLLPPLLLLQQIETLERARREAKSLAEGAVEQVRRLEKQLGPRDQQHAGSFPTFFARLSDQHDLLGRLSANLHLRVQQNRPDDHSLQQDVADFPRRARELTGSAEKYFAEADAVRAQAAQLAEPFVTPTAEQLSNLSSTVGATNYKQVAKKLKVSLREIARQLRQHGERKLEQMRAWVQGAEALGQQYWAVMMGVQQ